MNKVTHNCGENQYLFALLSGCDSWESIELFGKQRKRWLSRFLDLNNAIPSHQTFARVFSLIDPRERMPRR